MKLSVIFLIISILICCGHAAEDASCKKPPADVSLECCKFPEFHDEKAVEKIKQEFSNKTIKNEFLLSCKMNEAYFKACNLTKDSQLDIEAAHKYVDNLVKIEDWKPVLKSSADKCLEILAKQKNEIETSFEKAPFNIKKGECNVFYMAFGWCVSLQMFENCPAKVWTDKPQCVKGKEWVKKCGNSMEVWAVFDEESSNSEESN